MHQRRRIGDNLLPAHVALIRRLLATGWYTTRELTIETGLEKATVWFAVKTIARTQYVFARRTLLKGPQRAYRIYPEARQVQVVSARRDEDFCAPENEGQRHVLPYRVHRQR